MTYKTILTVVDISVSAASLKQAIELAQGSNAHLAVLIISIAPASPLYAYGYPPYGTVVVPDDWQDEIKVGANALSKKANEVEKILQDAAISGDVTSAYCELSLVEEEVAQRAAVCDLVLLSNSLKSVPEIHSRALAGALFRSPVGVISNAEKSKSALTAKRVFIAWDSSLPSSRAIHLALPVLVQADEVSVAVFDPVMSAHVDGEDPGVDVAAWLSRQGCNVNVQQYPSGGMEIGECIKKRALETGADLVVMGAYGHSRMRQRILGGTTRTMLEQQKLPVFFAH